MSYPPNIPGCACDRDDDSSVGDEELLLCPMHDRQLRRLGRDALTSMLIDYEAESVMLNAQMTAIRLLTRRTIQDRQASTCWCAGHADDYPEILPQ